MCIYIYLYHWDLYVNRWIGGFFYYGQHSCSLINDKTGRSTWSVFQDPSTGNFLPQWVPWVRCVCGFYFLYNCQEEVAENKNEKSLQWILEAGKELALFMGAGSSRGWSCAMHSHHICLATSLSGPWGGMRPSRVFLEEIMGLTLIY